MYLGIDPSLSATGLCLLNNELELMDWRLLKVEPGHPKRLLKYHDYLYNYIESSIRQSEGRLRIGMEGYAYGAGKGSGVGMIFNIGELGGVLKAACQGHEISILSPVPTQVKKFITGSGRAEKEEVEKEVRKDYGFKIKHGNKKERLDLYDAASVAIITYYFYRRKRRDDLDTDQKRILKDLDLKRIKESLRYFR